MLRAISSIIGRWTPSLNLNFLTGTMPSGLTFTRSSIATRVNASGNIETVTANTPRFDYDPVTLVCRGLLIEESRTNLRTYSNTFSNAAWTKTAISSVLSSSVLGLDNSFAEKLTEDNTNAQHYISGAFSGLTNQAYTYSIYTKAGERSWLVINLFTGTNNNVYYNLSGSGSLGSGSPAGASISLVRGGWYRCSLTLTGAVASVILQTALSDGVKSYTGDGTSGLYIWGAQLEAGSFATSYIPTTSAAVTRAADVCSMPTAGWYNQAQGSIAADCIPLTNISNQGVYSLNDGSGTNRLDLRTGFSDTRITVAGVDQTNQSTTASVMGVSNRYAFSYIAGNTVLVKNGAGSVSSAATASIPSTINKLSIGSLNGGSAAWLNGHIRSIRYYPTRLPNSYLQSLTT